MGERHPVRAAAGGGGSASCASTTAARQASFARPQHLLPLTLLRPLLRRGRERVRLTDFATGVRYMEFTEAVARSAQSGRAVALPLLA